MPLLELKELHMKERCVFFFGGGLVGGKTMPCFPFKKHSISMQALEKSVEEKAHEASKIKIV